MKLLTIADTGMNVSEIALGCMRIAKLSDVEIDTLVRTALDGGINFFDHADIYGGGQAEARFAEALDWRGGLREKLFLQTKCGIRKGMLDVSKGTNHDERTVYGQRHPSRLSAAYRDQHQCRASGIAQGD